MQILESLIEILISCSSLTHAEMPANKGQKIVPHTPFRLEPNPFYDGFKLHLPTSGILLVRIFLFRDAFFHRQSASRFAV